MAEARTLVALTTRGPWPEGHAGTGPATPPAALAREPAAAAAWLPTTMGIFGVNLSVFVATGAALPVLPRFVHGPLHGGDVAVGLAVGAFAVSAVVVRPLAGRWTDRRGRRPVLLAGVLLCSIAGAVLLAASSLAIVVAARLLLGVGEGLLFTAAGLPP